MPKYYGNVSHLKQRNPYEEGRRAYAACKPLWACPFIDMAARDWQRGYREAQAANGGVTYTTLPPRTRPATVIVQQRRDGRGEAFNTRTGF